jgi:hypothetical protein
VGRRKREPGPAGRERAEERSATAGPRAVSERSQGAAAAAAEPHKGRGWDRCRHSRLSRLNRLSRLSRRRLLSARAWSRRPPRGPGRAQRGRPWPATCRVSSRPTAVRRRSSCRRTRMCWSATKVRPGPGRDWPEEPGARGARGAGEAQGSPAGCRWGGGGVAPTRAGRSRVYLQSRAEPGEPCPAAAAIAGHRAGPLICPQLDRGKPHAAGTLPPARFCLPESPGSGGGAGRGGEAHLGVLGGRGSAVLGVARSHPFPPPPPPPPIRQPGGRGPMEAGVYFFLPSLGNRGSQPLQAGLPRSPRVNG